MEEPSPYWRAFRQLRFRMGWRKWERLPRHPDFDGKAWLTPCPKSADAVLDLTSWRGARPLGKDGLTLPDPIRIRPIEEADWEPLRVPFYAAFAADQPFNSLSSVRARAVASECLSHTRTGRDGDLL